MQSDGKLKGTQLKSNRGSVTVFTVFPALEISDSDNKLENGCKYGRKPLL